MQNRKIIITEDGSTSIALIGQNESFHSIYGAIQESKHIFIENGLKIIARNRRGIKIIEMGFGSGLNALLTFLYGTKHDLEIDYMGIEAFPLENTLIEKLNFPELLDLNESETMLFNKLHFDAWNKSIQLSLNFKIEKRLEKLENVTLKKEDFDLVYFDAFNPDYQPELWTEQIFRKLYLAMKPGGILMTYSAKGKVKRALKTAGFELNALPGPKGKREITQAIKIRII